MPKLKSIVNMHSDGFGILNEDGQFWSREFFIEKELAEEYISKKEQETPNWDLSKHTVVPVTVRMSYKL